MKFTLISAILALALSLSICFASIHVLEQAISEAQHFSGLAIDAVANGDDALGLEKLVALAEMWTDSKRWLEIITSHSDLQLVDEQYTEAKVNLERGHYDDFFRCMAVLDETLEHILNQERLSLANVL